MTRYGLIALLTLVSYGWLEWRGWDLLPTQHYVQRPVSVRTSPGGVRSYHVINGTGFHGGK